MRRGSVVKIGKFHSAYMYFDNAFQIRDYNHHHYVIREKPSTLEWKVLKVDSNKALLFCKTVVDFVQFDEQEWTIWNNTKIRNWLHDTFFNKAFTVEEQNKILTTKVISEVDREGETHDSEETEDKIFILSYNELCEYWFKSTMKCRDEYWLRERHDNFMSGYYKSCSLDPTYGGNVKYNDERDPEDKLGVRPAMWIDISLF